VLVLSVAGLQPSLDTSTLEILVSAAEVVVKIPAQFAVLPPTGSGAGSGAGAGTGAGSGAGAGAGAGVVQLGAKCPLASRYKLSESQGASASFKKKKGVLTVKISYSHFP
jgi:hypothetical protein